MREYIIKRLLLAVLTVFSVALVTFFLLRLTPGDAIMAKVAGGGNFSPERLNEMRDQLGLNKPILVQFGEWIGGIAHGDFGRSLNSQRPTLGEFEKGLPVTLELGIIALLSGLLIGIPIGVLAALKQDTLPDYIGRSIAIIGISIPNYWLGILLIVYPSIWFHWEWPRGNPSLIHEPMTNLKAYLVPGLILGFANSASLMRFLRTTMLEVLRQDFVRTARAKGLNGRIVVLRHAMRNSLLPVITLVGAQLGLLLGGSVIIEQLFSLNGIGNRTLLAVNARDYPQLQTNLLILAIVIVIANLLTDLSYAWIDPRISYARSSG
jgi:peptide/nickel transport system permease protein